MAAPSTLAIIQLAMIHYNWWTAWHLLTVIPGLRLLYFLIIVFVYCIHSGGWYEIRQKHGHTQNFIDLGYAIKHIYIVSVEVEAW